ncbi:LysR family transcriptional regulator [Denitratisoma sp. DHT3]|uniref:LysR family transcriptional regulator n=1 Tax=Denitratisoma sp. DHT3 TaxID=1981880 RepID=UPI001C9748A1|nr:LysR family transcriptional regulator [Denitratisoma sp. DHT3]
MKTINTARIDLNLLVVFEAIYTEGSVTRASARLNLTQPAISHALGRLRTLFGDPLFTRQGHAMVPTPMARSIVEPIASSLRTLDGTLSRAFSFDPGKAQRILTVGLPGGEESSFLPPLMRRVLEASCIDLVTVSYDRAQLESRLASGKMDLALDILLPHSTQVLHQPLVVEQRVVLARKDHPTVGPGLDLETYLAQQHIHVTSIRQGDSLLDTELSRLGMQRRIRLRCQDYLAACRIVAETDLILTMPAELAPECLAAPYDNQVLPPPVGLPLPGMELYLYWHGSADGDPANRWLREQLAQVLAPMPR